MPRYHYDVSISRQKRFIRRFKEFMLIVAGIAVIIGIIIGIDAIRQATQENTQEGAPSTTVVRPPIREFDSPYFQFTAPNGWTNIASETTANTFVYRRFRGQLVEQELTIHVNSAPSNLSATRVLPVRVDETFGQIIPGEVSDHCKTVAGANATRELTEVTLSEVRFLCQADGTNYLVLIGVRGGNANLRLERTDGSTATYNFLYRSSTTPPETNQLVDIINSFDAI